MASQTRITLAFVACILSAIVGWAQPGDRILDSKARLLDVIFPIEVPQRTYFLKMVLRYDGEDTQLVVVIYSDKEKYWIRRCEVTKYSLADGQKTQLAESLSRLTPETTDEEVQGIAAKLKVEVTRFTIAPESLNKSLGELKAIQISPVPADRVSVDEYSEYEFWYDSWQESVHYAITGPPGKGSKGSQDELIRWMIRFEARLPDLLKVPSAPKP